MLYLAAAKKVSRESVVRVAGRVKAIDKAPGGRELVPELFEIISLADSPLPLDVVEKVPADLDTRLDSRFLDSPETAGCRSFPDPQRCNACH